MTKKYSDLFINTVLKECKETGTKKPIAIKYNIPLTTLCHWCNNENSEKIEGNSYPLKIKEKVIEEYIGGLNAIHLAKKYKIIEGTVSSWVRPYARKRGVINKVGKEDYFDNINTERKAYYLGWIMADGNVSIHNGQYCLKIHIATKDRELIDSFVRDIDCTNKIQNKNDLLSTTGNRHQSTYISITSVHMVKSLIKLGVVPNKTSKEIIPEIPKKLISHFIRGFFDGDGIVINGKVNRSSGFVGNLSILHEIESHIPFGTSISVRGDKVIYGQRTTSRKDKLNDLYNYLYKDSTVYLKRKHDTLFLIANGNTEVTSKMRSCSDTGFLD